MTVSKVILLDTGVLGIITHPRVDREIVEWVKRLLIQGIKIKVPEISDYELRRELIRANLKKSVERLDALKDEMGYIPIDTQSMRKAAELWARTRNEGRPTADDKALDGDMILVAQALQELNQGYEAVIATTNVGHLSRFIDAREWKDI